MIELPTCMQFTSLRDTRQSPRRSAHGTPLFMAVFLNFVTEIGRIK